MTAVYAAREVATDTACAVKLLRPDWEDQSTAIKLLQREARACLAVRHAHLVSLRHAHVLKAPHYLVTELLPGESLRRRLRRDYRMPVSEAVWIARQVADVDLKALKTLPPKPYTQGELVKSMKGVAKLVSDPRLKQKLKDTVGIGTEATRANIIGGLIARGYLVKKGRAIRASDAAFTLIDAVPAAIADPGTTAVWEQALDMIEATCAALSALISVRIRLDWRGGNFMMMAAARMTFVCSSCGAAASGAIFL